MKPLFIILIVVIVIVVVVIIAIVVPVVLTQKKSIKTQNTPPSETPLTPQQLIDIALKRADITTVKLEGFENNSTNSTGGEFKFTTLDSIMNNFPLFITTYYPSLDINKINELTMKYGNGKTIDQIIAGHPGVDYFDFLSNVPSIISNFVINTSTNEYDLILAGIAKIFLRTRTMSPGEREDRRPYYIGDYKNANEFTIYYLPPSYDIRTLRANAASIQGTARSGGPLDNSMDQPYKISLFDSAKKDLLVLIRQAHSSEYPNFASIPNEKINELRGLWQKNKEPILKMTRYVLVGSFVKIETGIDINSNSGFGKEMTDFFSSNPFTDDLNPYFMFNEQNFSYMFEHFNSNYKSWK
jgi:hypothetical protein